MLYQLDLPDDLETKRVGQWGHNIMFCRYGECNYCSPNPRLILLHILKCPFRQERFPFEGETSRRPYVPVDQIKVKVTHQKP